MENSNYLKKWRQLPQNEKNKIIKDIETAKADIIQSNHLQFLQTVGSTGYFNKFFLKEKSSTSISGG